MAINIPNTVAGALRYVAGSGIDITGNTITNTQGPASVVLDNSIASPATITDFSGAYIVPAGATGPWLFRQGQIAISADAGATWTFQQPTAGMRRQVVGGPNAGATYRWTGVAWALATPTVPAGAILAARMFQGTEVTLSVAANVNTIDATMTVTYTPVSNNSNLIVTVAARYRINGTGADTWVSTLRVNGVTQRTQEQRFDGSTGGGTRGGVCFPLAARYTNTALGPLSISARLFRSAGDDTGFFPTTTDVSINVIEVQR